MHAAWMRMFRPLAPIVGAMLMASLTPAADPPAAAAKPDFATLDALLAKGDYAGAIAVADALVTAVRPKPRADDYLARSVELIKALMRRGGAELRLGRIDAAEATFTEAHRTFKDSEFRRLVVLATRQGGPRLAPAVVDLELAWLDLLFLRMTVVVERLKSEATRWALEDAGTAAREQDLRESVDRCLDQWKGLRKAAVEARQSFGERFNASSGAVPASAFARSLAGPFRESLLDGLSALEQSRLPAAVLPSGGTGPGKEAGQRAAAAGDAGDKRSRLRAEATGHLTNAAAELDGIVAALAPKAGGLRPEMRADLALLEAELLMARARLCIEAGESAAARKDLERVLELRREVGVLRKLTAPDSHVDLAEPLVLVADIGIAESRRLLDDGRADSAKVAAEETQRTLDRATSLVTGDDHPLRGRLDVLRQQLASSLQAIEESIPRSDAVEAAARRMIRAIEATPVVPAGASGQESGVRSPDSASLST